MGIPVFSARHVYAAVDPADAVEAVRRAFVDHARGDWLMPSKVYVPAPPDGDFRAMPARGGGHAVLKWVTSFPRNPERGLPTVSGIVLLSDAAAGWHRPEVAVGRCRHVDLGGHQPVAARVVDERAADSLDRVGGVDGRVHVPRGKDGNPHGGAYPRYLTGNSRPPGDGCDAAPDRRARPSPY